MDQEPQSEGDEEEIVVSGPQPQAKKRRTTSKQDNLTLEQEVPEAPIELDEDEAQHFHNLPSPERAQPDDQQDDNDAEAENDEPQDINMQEPDRQDETHEDDHQPEEFQTNGVCISTGSSNDFLLL